MRAFGFWLGVLLLFVLFSFSCGAGNGTKEVCPLPFGIEAPKEVIVAGMAGVEEVEGALQALTATGLKIAIDLINEDKCLLPETRLKLVLGYDESSPVQGLSEFFRIQNAYHPVGWAGPSFSSVTRPVALASPLTETPVVSSTASMAALSNAEEFPFFSRVFPSDAFQGRLLADLCNAFGWDRVATVSATDADAASVHEEFTNRAAFHSIKSLSTSTFPLASNAPNRKEYLAQMRAAVRKTKASGARVILLSCFGDAAADYFTIAIEEGMLGPPYTYLVAAGLSRVEVSVYMEGDTLEKFQKHSRGMFGIHSQGVQPSSITDEWLEAWLSADPTEYFGAGEEELLPVVLALTVSLFRDAMYVLAWGIDRLIRRGVDPSDGNALLETIQQETDFYGLTGQILLEPNGDRAPAYEIANAQDSSLDMAVVGTANASGLFFEGEAVFYDGTTDIPDAAERVFVDWGDIEAIVMVGLFGFGLIVTFICLIVMMLHRSTPIMNYSSPRFVCGMALGVVVGFMNIFVWTGEPSTAQCDARPWLLVLGFVMIFGHLYAKAFRFLLVMEQRKQLLFRPIPDIHLFVCVFFYLLVFSIPCIVWTVAFPLEVTRSDDNPDNDKVNIICDGENSDVFLWVLVGLGGLSLLVGVVVAFLNRNYHDFFSEATHIGYTMFTVCVTCCVVLPMLFILKDKPHAFYIVLMLGVFLSNGAVLVFMFFPKIYVIFSPGKNVVPLDATGGLKTMKSSLSQTGES